MAGEDLIQRAMDDLWFKLVAARLDFPDAVEIAASIRAVMAMMEMMIAEKGRDT